MAEYAELYIDRGADFNVVIELNDDNTNMPQNTSGYVITSQLRRSLLSVNASANLTCSVLDGSNGELSLSMTAANTANLRPGNYFFDVKVVNPRAQNETTRLIEGVIFVTHGITR
jgi:hypothetical protein